ncbi:MAG: hypothetical protein HYU64_13060 [Armatimonadetes bacterium]|nr:hypothetical protein [Armatimonadota bacterium]
MFSYQYGPFHQLRDLAEAVTTEKISVEEYEQMLNAVQANLHTWSSEINGLNIPQDVYFELSKPLVNTFLGLDLFKQAIVEMARFVESRDQETLSSGLKYAEEAHQKLNEALTLSHESMSLLKQQYGLSP